MELEFGMPKVIEYIKYREKYSMSMLDIQKETAIGEADVYALELAYQCYRKNIPLDCTIASIVTDERTIEIKQIVKLFDSMTDEQIKTIVEAFSAQINNGEVTAKTLKNFSVVGEIIHELRKKGAEYLGQ